MKISSVSKKVLASALSAALAAAFAPPAAFADRTPVEGKTVTVTYDANGGTIPSGSLINPDKVNVNATLLKDSDDSNYYVQLDDSVTATRTDDYAQDTTNKWFIDTDNDGQLDFSETASVVDSSDSKTYLKVSEGTTAVTVKVNWYMPMVLIAGFDASDTYESDSAASINVSIGYPFSAIDSHKYTLKLTTPGGTELTKTFASSDADATIDDLKSDGSYSFYFTDNPVSGDKQATSKSNLVSGDYLVQILDNDSVISSQKLALCSITVKVGDVTKSKLVAKGSTVTLDDINALTDDYTSYIDAGGTDVVDADTDTVGTQIKVTDDAIFIAKKKSYAEIPLWAVAKKTSGNTTQYVLTVIPAANTSVVVSTGKVNDQSETEYTKQGTITGAQSYTLDSDVTTIKLVVTDTLNTGKADKTVVLSNVTNAVGDWDLLTDTMFGFNIGKTSVKWPEASGVAIAIASGKAAYEDLAAKLFASEGDINAVMTASYKTLYEAVAAEAKAQLEAYANEAQVVVGDTIYKMDATTYATQTENLNKKMDYFKWQIANVDTPNAQSVIYFEVILSVLIAANDALNAAVEDTSAKDVTAQLKAATSVSSVKAAITAYNALTDVEKSLVPTADVVAANKIIADAEVAAADSAAAAASNAAAQAKKDAEQKAAELEQAKKDAEQKDAQIAQKDAAIEQAQKDAAQAKADAGQKAIEDAKKLADDQDDKAVQYCNSIKKKTVKLAKESKKTAKKATVKWNSKVSESGNAVAYAKASGSAKVTVSADGVVTLKKGVKKGRYKVRVKVTCGTATRTVTAKFIVK